jgi:type I restriction enzyme, S subunit
MSEWKAIDELFDYEKGTLQSSKCTPGKYPFITAAEEWKTHQTFTHDCEALIFAMAASGSLGRTHYVNGKFISSDLCFILTPKKGLRLDLTFYYRLFNFLRTDIVKKTATGTSKLAINQTNFGAYKLPYFDYEHQLSFRGKIETITGINEEFSEGIDYQLSLLTRFRQAVLQEAIEGKLTAEWRRQNPELISGDNHASNLLEKIRVEKDRLIREGKIRKEKASPPITDDEKPFHLPDGWVWCRLGEIVQSMTNGLYKPEVFYKETGVVCLRMYNIQEGKISFHNLKRMILTEEEIKTYSLLEGDLLLNRVNSVELLGKAAYINKYDEPLVYESKNIRVRFVNKEIIPKYVNVVFLTKIIRHQILKNYKKVTGQASINQDQLSCFQIPFLPFAEQQAVVERVDKLMAMVDELEKQVTERKEESELMMQSVLREAFAG